MDAVEGWGLDFCHIRKPDMRLWSVNDFVGPDVLSMRGFCSSVFLSSVMSGFAIGGMLVP